MKSSHAVWFDTDNYTGRCHSLELHSGRLYERERATPGDVWGPPKCLDDSGECTYEAADIVAGVLGLAPEPELSC